MKILLTLTIILISTKHLLSMEEQSYQRLPVLTQQKQTAISSESAPLLQDKEQSFLATLKDQHTALDIDLQDPDQQKIISTSPTIKGKIPELHLDGEEDMLQLQEVVVTYRENVTHAATQVTGKDIDKVNSLTYYLQLKRICNTYQLPIFLTVMGIGAVGCTLLAVFYG